MFRFNFFRESKIWIFRNFVIFSKNIYTFRGGDNPLSSLKSEKSHMNCYNKQPNCKTSIIEPSLDNFCIKLAKLCSVDVVAVPLTPQTHNYVADPKVGSPKTTKTRQSAGKLSFKRKKKSRINL